MTGVGFADGDAAAGDGEYAGVGDGEYAGAGFAETGPGVGPAWAFFLPRRREINTMIRMIKMIAT
ncbi:MAG TPA: hypothetical protein VLE19_12975, partial [Pyrinomonadaceae bacterium]|nr:hypothetical protein [Pyrinomonadaceae bacterium]